MSLRHVVSAIKRLLLEKQNSRVEFRATRSPDKEGTVGASSSFNHEGSIAPVEDSGFAIDDSATRGYLIDTVRRNLMSTCCAAHVNHITTSSICGD